MRYTLIIICLISPLVLADTPAAIDPPKSPQAIDAQAKHDAVVKKARQAYTDALLAADKQLLSDLDHAMSIAMANKDVEEVKRIDAEKGKATEDLTMASGQASSSSIGPVLPIGDWRVKTSAGTYVWTIEKDGVKHAGAPQKIMPAVDGSSFIFRWRDGWVESLTPQGSWLRYDGWSPAKAGHYQTETPDNFGIATRVGG